MCWDVFVGIFAAHDCCCEDWIGRGEAGSNCESGEEVEAWDEGVDEGCRDEPALKYY